MPPSEKELFWKEILIIGNYNDRRSNLTGLDSIKGDGSHSLFDPIRQQLSGVLTHFPLNKYMRCHTGRV